MLVTSMLACGGDDDAPADVTITTLTAPQLLVVRDDADGRWLPLTAVDATTFRYRATGPYRVTAGCDEGDGFFTIWQFARTPADDPDVAIPCGTPPRDASIDTTMVQAGTVALEDSIALSSEPNWTVSLPTAPGPHDLVALSADHILVQRQLDVSGTLTLPDLDLVSAGTALVPGAITVANADAAETVTGRVSIQVGGTFGRVYRGAPEGALLVPAPVLQSGDVQEVLASATRADGTSRFAARVTSSATSLTLPEPIAGATFALAGNDVTATWQTADAGDVSVFVFANSADFSTIWLHDLELSERYADRLGTEATLELVDVPNIPPALLFDYATIEHDRTLAIQTASGDDRHGVSAQAAFNVPPDALRARQLVRSRARLQFKTARTNAGS